MKSIIDDIQMLDYRGKEYFIRNNFVCMHYDHGINEKIANEIYGIPYEIESFVTLWIRGVIKRELELWNQYEQQQTKI